MHPSSAPISHTVRFICGDAKILSITARIWLKLCTNRAKTDFIQVGELDEGACYDCKYIYFRQIGATPFFAGIRGMTGDDL